MRFPLDSVSPSAMWSNRSKQWEERLQEQFMFNRTTIFCAVFSTAIVLECIQYELSRITEIVHGGKISARSARKRKHVPVKSMNRMTPQANRSIAGV